MRNKIVVVIFFFISFCGTAFGQWQQVGFYGTVYSFYTDGTALLAGTDYGVYRSSDNGVHWLHLQNDLTIVRTNSFASVNGMIFAATQNGISLAAGKGVFRSSDHGMTWAASNNGLKNHEVASLTAVGSDLFCGTFDSGVYRSTDNGASWKQANKGLIWKYVNMLAANGSTLFAAAYDGLNIGLFRSTDHGANWTLVRGMDYSLQTFLATNDTIILGTGNGVNISFDNGDTWADSALTFVAVTTLAMQRGAIVAGTLRNGIYRSTDNGKSWTNTDSAQDDLSITALYKNGSDLLAAAPQANNILRSPDAGASWATLVHGLPASGNAYIGAVGNDLVISSYSGVLRSSDQGSNWHIIVPDSGAGFHLLYANDVYLFAEDTGGLFRSSDTGASWVKLNISMSKNVGLFLYNTGSALFLGRSDNFLYRSTDNGMNWVLTNNGLASEEQRAFTSNGATLFDGTFGGGVFVSTDNGNSWTPSNNGLGDLKITSLAQTNGAVFASTQFHGLFRSSDNGSHWTTIATPAGDSVNAALFAIGNVLFISEGYKGFYASTNIGGSWKIANDGGLSTNVYAMSRIGDALYASAENGIWSRSLAELGVGTVQYQPADASIHIYPNPATADATITFSSAKHSSVTVTILDLLGREVARVYDGSLDAGEHSFDLNARNISAGNYFCVVREEGEVYVAPIIISR